MKNEELVTKMNKDFERIIRLLHVDPNREDLADLFSEMFKDNLDIAYNQGYKDAEEHDKEENYAKGFAEGFEKSQAEMMAKVEELKDKIIKEQEYLDEKYTWEDTLMGSETALKFINEIFKVSSEVEE